MENTAPTPQEIAAQLRIMNRAQLNYRHAAGRDEKNQADETFQACWDWFKWHNIALKQNAESGFWEADQEQQRAAPLPLQQLPQPKKPSLHFLLLQYQIQPEALVRESGLPLLTAIALNCGYGTTEEIAQAALNGLNALRGTRYTLADIEIELHRRQQQ